MASLIPDTGSLSANTTGAMQNYLGTVKATNDALEKPTDILNTYMKNMLDQKRIEEDMALRRKADVRAETELGMQQAERDRVNQERTATNNALQAVVNPTKYGANKMAGEQAAIQQTLASMSPEDRVVAEQQIKANYDPMASQKGWLDAAINATGVDIGRVLDVKNKDYEVKAKTPGTPEYIAAQNAQFDMYKKEQDLAHGFRMSEIGAQNANAMNLLKAGWDAPKEVVDSKTGKAYFLKPSEMVDDKHSGINFVDKSTYASQLSSALAEEKYQNEKKLAEEKIVREGKTALATTKGSIGNPDTVTAVTGDINSIADDYGVKLTDMDINNAMVAAKNGNVWTDRGKPDVDTDLFRSILASTIASQSKKPLEEVLKKIEGKQEDFSTNKPKVNSLVLPKNTLYAPSLGLYPYFND